MSALRVIALSLLLYAVFLPAMWFAGRNYVPVPRPPGSVVEMIKGFHFDHPDHYVIRSHVFSPKRYPDASTLAVYEDLTRLADARFTVDNGDYVVRFKTSDGSDARSNMRSYWIAAE